MSMKFPTSGKGCWRTAEKTSHIIFYSLLLFAAAISVMRTLAIAGNAYAHACFEPVGALMIAEMSSIPSPPMSKEHCWASDKS